MNAELGITTREQREPAQREALFREPATCW